MKENIADLTEETTESPLIWKKNTIVTLKIDGYNADGAGVGRVDGRVVFVAGTIVGEVWEVNLTKVNKNFAFGRGITCLTGSPHRIMKDCPHSGKCGGCQLRHMNYEEELRLKQGIVENALSRIGGIQEEILPILGSPRSGNYRNKVQYQVGGSDKWVKIGFFRPRSHDVLDVETCLLQRDFSTIARQVLKDWMTHFHVNPYDETSGKGTIRHLFLRCNEKDEVVLCLVATRRSLPHFEELLEKMRTHLPNMTGFLINVNKDDTNVVMGEETATVFGSPLLTMELMNLRFQVSVHSFFQVNLPQTEVLYGKILEFAQLTGTESVLDLYCGTGSIALALSKDALKVHGLEISPQAVADAKENAKINACENVEFLLEDCGKLAESQEKYDVVVVDPPRKGLACPDKVLGYVGKKLIYVSCDAGTLARDLKFFTEHGLKVKKIQPVDMFPRTKHVESVVLLERE